MAVAERLTLLTRITTQTVIDIPQSALTHEERLKQYLHESLMLQTLLQAPTIEELFGNKRHLPKNSDKYTVLQIFYGSRLSQLYQSDGKLNPVTFYEECSDPHMFEEYEADFHFIRDRVSRKTPDGVMEHTAYLLSGEFWKKGLNPWRNTSVYNKKQPLIRVFEGGLFTNLRLYLAGLLSFLNKQYYT